VTLTLVPRGYAQVVVRRTLLLDGGIALVVLGVTLGMLARHGFGTPGPGVRDLDALGVVLAAATALPLVAWRVAPLPVFVFVAAASTALVWLAYPLDVPLGALVAVYTLGLTHAADARLAWRAAAAAFAIAFVPATALAYLARGGQLGEIAAPLAFWALIMAGAWIAADRDRLRRALISDLAERARSAEHEAEQERRLAVTEERLRIARDLHDSAGHALNVILVQAGAARLLRERDPEASVRSLHTVEEVARETIGEIERLVSTLRQDDEEPLTPADPAALEDLVRRSRAAGLAVETEISGSRPSLPSSVAGAAYRILQEGLTNASRHGQGSARVAVRFEREALLITITNPTTANGRRPPGHGIAGMRERAALVGGTLEAAAREGIFRLSARLPYRPVAS
jgi:signal transduction histidine kinase